MRTMANNGLILALCAHVLIVCVVCQDDGPVVETANGLVQGVSNADRFNRTFDAFFGVPFAQPPVGDLRWQPAQRPVDSWTGIRNATEFAPHCIQILTRVYPVIGIGGNDSEDCLYLNVYVPVSVEDALQKNLPVMFFFYGGAYLFGSAEMYPGQELATDQNVVVVTTTYRTSVLGFLSTEDSASPGNYGLWDGKAALEWTVENIAAFGGNPQMITVFGQSAGAGMTMHSVLSPQTNGLFQRAIAISGSGSAITAFTQNAKRSSQYLADIFFCNTTDSEEIVSCLMEIDGKTLDTMGLTAPLFNESRIPDYVPVIDGQFVPQDTRLSLEQGVGSDIDLMTGHTVHDGAGFALGILLGAPPIVNFTRLNRSQDGNRDREEVEDFFKIVLGGLGDPDELYQILVDRYPELNSTDNVVCSQKATEVTTSWWFSSGTHFDAMAHHRATGAGNTFAYRYEYRHSFLTGYPDWVNGSHVDDLYSVLGDPFMRYMRERFFDKVDFSEDDELVGRNVRGRFGNFAYSGDPNQGPNSVAMNWAGYTDNTEILIQSTEERMSSLSAEEQDELRWYLYEWWPLLKPIWQDAATGEEEEAPADDTEWDRIEFDEDEFLDALDRARRKLHQIVGFDKDMMAAIDDQFLEALVDRESYRP